MFFHSRTMLRAPEGAASGAAAGAGTGGAGAATTAPGAAAGAAAGGTGAAPAPGATVAAPAFADSLPADLRELGVFKDIKDVDGLARSYANAAKMVGMDKARVVALPADGDADGWAKVYTALGRPDAPDKYGFTPPAGVQVDTALQSGFQAKAFEAGLSAKQANDLYAWWNGEAAKAREAMAGQSAAKMSETTTALKPSGRCVRPEPGARETGGGALRRCDRGGRAGSWPRQ